MVDQVFANQAAMLYTSYYLIQILIYRPFISFTSISNDASRPRANPIAYPSFPFPALSICISAAQSCARIVDAQMKRGYAYIPNLINTASICAAVLMADVWDLKAKERTELSLQLEDVKPRYVQTIEARLEDVAVFMKALEGTESTWGNAHMYLYVPSSLYVNICSQLLVARLHLRECLPSAVCKSRPLGLLHVLAPVHPQAQASDLDQEPVARDRIRQPAPSLPLLAPLPAPTQYPPHTRQLQAYPDVSGHTQWAGQSYDNGRLYDISPPIRRNSVYASFSPSSVEGEWRSQSASRVRAYSTHSFDARKPNHAPSHTETLRVDTTVAE